MANPTMPDISESTANALAAGAAHDETGIKYIPSGSSKTDSPKLHTLQQQQVHHLMELIGGVNQGRVYQLSGLNVGAFDLEYLIGSTEYSYAGDVTFALTASVTNYIYLDTAGTLKKDTSSWPSGDHYKLAKVVTDATSITSIEDSRFKNHPVGAISNWWTFNPTATVNLNNQWLDNVGRLKFSAPVDVTLNVQGEVASPTASAWLRVDTFAGSASFNFDTFSDTYPAGTYGQLVIISSKDAARVVTVKTGLGFTLANGDCVLDDPDKFLILIGNNLGYVEWFRSETTLGTLNADLNVNNKSLLDVGVLNFNFHEELIIAAGVVTKTQSWVKILNQDNDPTDELDTISGGTTGDWLILQARSNLQVPTIKHGTGNIELQNNRDFVLSDIARVLLLKYDVSTWREMSRSHSTIFDLTGTGKGLRFEPTHYIPETVTLNTTYSPRIYVNVETLVEKIVADVVTAPSGGPCVVELLDDGAIIATATIADGANQGISSVVDATVAAGSILEFRTTTVNGAAKLSVTVLGRRDVPSS